MTRDHARQLALLVIQHKAEGYGRTREDLRAIIYEGFGAPGSPGYEISHGKITVPSATGPKPRHTFDTDALMDEIEQRQPDLFGA